MLGYWIVRRGVLNVIIGALVILGLLASYGGNSVQAGRVWTIAVVLWGVRWGVRAVLRGPAGTSRE